MLQIWTALRRGVLCTFLLLPGSLLAVGFDPLSIEALTERAEIVLHGTVLSRTCQRDPAGRIYTRVEITVSEVWKGSVSGSPMEVLHGGGTLGEQQSHIAGQVEYAIGEEVVAFLVRNERGDAVTVGLKQGKFHVSKDAQGVKLVASPFHGRAGIGSSSTAPLSASKMANTSRLELADLKKQVQEARQ